MIAACATCPLTSAAEALDRPDRLFARPPTEAAARFVGISAFLRGRVDGSQVHTPLGALTITTPIRLDDATFAIRPEHLRIMFTPAPNALPGTIRDSVYKGEFVEHVVALGNDPIRVRSYDAADRPAPGTTVYVQFPPEHLFVVA